MGQQQVLAPPYRNVRKRLIQLQTQDEADHQDRGFLGGNQLIGHSGFDRVGQDLVEREAAGVRVEIGDGCFEQWLAGRVEATQGVADPETGRITDPRRIDNPIGTGDLTDLALGDC